MRVSPSRGKVAALLGALLLVIAGGVALRLTWSDLMLWQRLSPQFTLHRWKNGQGYPEYRHRGTGIIFVYLPGGTFRMGAIEDEAVPNSGMHLQLHPAVRDSLAAKLPAADRAPEYPPHAVTLSPFLIAKYEVSQAEWEKVTGTNPSGFKGDRLPVEKVSWLEAKRFCDKTSLSLPTEAQWEYACRGGTETLFAFGDALSKDQANFDDDVWDDTEGRTVPVDAGPPNRFGLHNMHGNVWEWCEDAYVSDFYSRPEASGLDPVCTLERPTNARETRRVARGGGWLNEARACQSAHRAHDQPGERDNCAGVRPVFNLR